MVEQVLFADRIMTGTFNALGIEIGQLYLGEWDKKKGVLKIVDSHGRIVGFVQHDDLKIES